MADHPKSQGKTPDVAFKNIPLVPMRLPDDSLLNEEQRTRIGECWAHILMLKRDPVHSDRFQLTTGTKTALGVYHTLRRLVAYNDVELF